MENDRIQQNLKKQETGKTWHFQKSWEKTHTANPYKQGLPEMQDGNEASPLKGIDVIFPIACIIASYWEFLYWINIILIP